MASLLPISRKANIAVGERVAATRPRLPILNSTAPGLPPTRSRLSGGCPRYADRTSTGKLTTSGPSQ